MFVNNITVAYGTGELPPKPPGFPYGVGIDFNKGAGGKYVGAFYSMGEEKAISDIRVSAGSNEADAQAIAQQDGYTLVPADLHFE